MSKVIIMSIQPKWLAKILNGEKTIDIRKTMPKCELPIDVYLYCMKNKTMLCDFGDNEFPYKNGGYELSSDLINIKNHDAKILNGKVVAKFTLNKIEEIMNFNWEAQTATLSPFDLSLKSCISIKDLNNEFIDCKAYYIDNLVIFDKPMELREFSTSPYTDWVQYRVRKAPQSWQYAWLFESSSTMRTKTRWECRGTREIELRAKEEKQ